MALRAARQHGLEHVRYLTQQHQMYVRLQWSIHQMLMTCDDFTDTLEDLGFSNAPIHQDVTLARYQLSLFLQQCNLAMLALQFSL